MTSAQRPNYQVHVNCYSAFIFSKKKADDVPDNAIDKAEDLRHKFKAQSTLSLKILK